jgi:hypothetical protein
MGQKQMSREGITLPPYHHACRSYTVPRMTYVTVPVGQTGRTYSQLAVGALARAGSNTQVAQRPPLVIQDPSKSSPAALRNPPPDDFEQFGPDPDLLGKGPPSVVEVLMDTMNSIVPVISTMSLNLGRDLTREELGNLLRGLLLEQVGDSFTGASLSTEQPILSGLPFNTRAMNQQQAWAKALQFAGPVLRAALRGKSLPTFRSGPVPGYYPDRNLIVARGITDDYGIMRGGQLFVDSLGDHRYSGNTLRNLRAVPGPLVRLNVEAWGLLGPWVDIHDGRVMGKSNEWLSEQYQERTEFTAAQISSLFSTDKPSMMWAQAAPRFLKGRAVDLAVNWEVLPEQVAGFIALQAGDLLSVQGVGELSDAA